MREGHHHCLIIPPLSPADPESMTHLIRVHNLGRNDSETKRPEQSVFLSAMSYAFEFEK